MWPAFRSTFEELGELEEGQIVCDVGGKPVGVVYYNNGAYSTYEVSWLVSLDDLFSRSAKFTNHLSPFSHYSVR